MSQHRKRTSRQQVAPYGYILRDGRIFEHPQEQKILHIMMLRRQQGKTFFQIAVELNENTLQTRSGQQWNKQSISHTLRRAGIREPRVFNPDDDLEERVCKTEPSVLNRMLNQALREFWAKGGV